MTLARLRVAKSETREMVDRERVIAATRPATSPSDEPAWPMRSSSFAIAVAVIVAALVILVLVLR